MCESLNTKELLIEHGPTRDDVMKWAKEEHV